MAAINSTTTPGQVSDWIATLRTLVDLMEREVKEQNNTDFDTIEALVSGCKSKLLELDEMIFNRATHFGLSAPAGRYRRISLRR